MGGYRVPGPQCVTRSEAIVTVGAFVGGALAAFGVDLFW